MSWMLSWFGFVAVALCLGSVHAQNFPKAARNFTADCTYTFTDHGRSWSSGGKMWYYEGKHLYRQDYTNGNGAQVELLQLSDNIVSHLFSNELLLILYYLIFNFFSLLRIC
jgi:hypothetical protein